MSEQSEPAGAPSEPTADPVDPADTAASDAVPGDPVDRALAQVAEAVASARAGVPTPADPPAVPTDDEVTRLEQAHETLRTTLDRVDRGG